MSKVVDKINDKFIKSENKSTTTIFLTESKNLFKSKSIKATRKPNLLISNTKKAFNFLK